MHHFLHQHSNREATTIWAGCGAIRREVFLKLGGFNETCARPSIEDIELGLQLRHAGYYIRFCPDVKSSSQACQRALNNRRQGRIT
jgi:GT2 family glycosyltransferase